MWCLMQEDHSPEACAQLCINDISCKSFNAHTNECYLSYNNRADAEEADTWVCDADNNLNYFEKVTVLHD